MVRPPVHEFAQVRSLVILVLSLFRIHSDHGSSKPSLHLKIAQTAHPTIVAIIADENGVVLDRTRGDPEVVVCKPDFGEIERASPGPLTRTIFGEQRRFQVSVVLCGCRRDQELIDAAEKSSTAAAFSRLPSETAAP